MRRPSFDQLNPTLIIDDEESILGNPTLDQETALGLDAGVDFELGGQDAIMGVNAFYRDISDKIELDGVPDGVNEIFQEFVDEDIEATVWVNNPNDGKIWGVEFDFSSPVSFIYRELPRVRELHLDRLGDPRRQRELPDRPAVLAAAGLHLQRRASTT